MKAVCHSLRLYVVIILLGGGAGTLPLFSRMNWFNLFALSGGGEQKYSFSARVCARARVRHPQPVS